MRIFNTHTAVVVEKAGDYYILEENWDSLLNRDDLYEYLGELMLQTALDDNGSRLIESELLPPVGKQEVWASGVTYYKSREARMDESKDTGGGDFYDRVYYAKRPEIFMKAPGYRVVGSGQPVRIREDSQWNVPEPELTLVITSNRQIVGYTIGNDMSSRDIEGENPLYLPQAKSYDGSTAVGPCIFVPDIAISPETRIKLEIVRLGKTAFKDEISIDRIKRNFEELVEYLYREMSFPHGALLMTGTGIVPPNEFSLDHGDEVRISIDQIGTLINTVA